MTEIWSQFRHQLRDFSRANRGNVALTFALATLPIIGGVGAAMDFSHANSVKAAMQAALDSTALMLARDAATLSNADLQTKAKNEFTALFTRPEAKNVVISATYTTSGGSQVVVNGSATVATSLMAIAGYANMPISGTSTAKWGNTRLRVALVLDNTGSMASAGKMTALRSAAQNLLTQLQSAATTNGDVLVSIIPFTTVVNVGSTNNGQSWIDWSDYGNCTGNSSSSADWTKALCTADSQTWTVYSSSKKSSWSGCISDRGGLTGPDSAAYDTNVTAISSSIAASKYPAVDYSIGNTDYCLDAQAMGLSYNWSSMSTLVAGMQPNGATNQNIGLQVGWMSLVGGGPFATPPAMDPNYTYVQAIILLTDGLNTQNRWYGDGSNTSTSVDNRQKLTCANAKAANITLYMIQVNTDGDPTSTVLQNCASSSDKFYIATSASDISGIFAQIGTALSKLRVAK